MAVDVDVDWTRCILCQTKLRIGIESYQLICPKSGKGATEIEHGFYENIHNKIHQLWNAGIPLAEVKMPKELTAETMFQNDAKWHRQCKVKYANTKVQQMLKSHQKNQPPTAPESEIQAPKRSRENFLNNKCLFCQQVQDPEHLHNVQTLEFGMKHRAMAEGMNDSIMAVRLSGNDMIAAEGKYHRGCCTGFYNRYKKYKAGRTTDKEKEEQFLDERAFLELFDSMKNDATNGEKIFIMAELNEQFEERRKHFNLPPATHTTRLKERIIKAFDGDLVEQGTATGPKRLLFADGLNTLVKDALVT